MMALALESPRPIDILDPINLTLNFEKVCRICMDEKPGMKSLYDSCLDDMIMSVAQIEVKYGDGLPELICFQCVLQVSRSFRFKTQCEKSDAILRKHVIDLEIQEKLNKSSLVSYIDTDVLADPISDNDFVEQIISNQIIEDDDVSNLLILENMDANLTVLQQNKEIDSYFVSDFDEIKNGSDETYAINKNEDINPTIILFHCNTCNLNFNMENDLEDHNRMKHIPNDLRCEVCGKVFLKHTKLQRHLKIHSKIKPFSCLECGKEFLQNCNLSKHLKTHTGELRNIEGKPNLCSVCGKSFKWTTSLNKHMKYHTKIKVFNCPCCPKYYVDRRTLNIHLRNHCDDKPFPCNSCDKKFTQLCNLEKHMRIHSGDKPFECRTCGKKFTQSSALTVHMRTHTGEKPYLCQECGKSFSGSNTLAVHKKIHEGKRSFVCDEEGCSKSFIRLDSFLIHKRMHTGETPYRCCVCNKGFASNSQLTRHTKSKICSPCNTDLATLYQCAFCIESFDSIENCLNHQQQHTELFLSVATVSDT